MSKFCTRCGKPLPESGVCDCQAAPQEPEQEVTQEVPQAEPQAVAQEVPEAAPQQDAPQAEPQEAPQPEPEAAPQPEFQPGAQQAPQGEAPMFQAAAPAGENAFVKKVKETAGRTGTFLKNYWHDPMKATVAAMKAKDMALAVVMIVINVLLSGLVLFAGCSKFVGLIMKSTLGLFGASADVGVPFFTSMFMGILTAVVALALSMLVVFALVKLAHIHAGPEYIVVALGLNTVFCSAALVLALLFAIFGWFTGVALAMTLCAIIWCVLLVLLLTKVFGVPTTGLHVTVAAVALTVALGLTFWVGSKLIGQVGEGLTVDGYSVGQGIDDLDDLFGDMEEFF